MNRIKMSFSLFLLVLATVAMSQTADEVTAEYILFIGGAPKWKSIKSITSSGIYNYGGMEFPFRSYSKSPNLYKYIVSSRGKSFSQAYDGKEGWRIDGFKNETRKTILKDEQATAMANESDVELESPFIDYQKKGNTITLEGNDTVGGKLCYKIKLTRQNGEESTCFFDNVNFTLVKKQIRSKNTEMDNSMLDIFYSDYRSTGGIRLPYKITCKSQGQDILIITVREIKLNLPVADNIFKP